MHSAPLRSVNALINVIVPEGGNLLQYETHFIDETTLFLCEILSKSYPVTVCRCRIA